jgi:hypothetical protein
MAAAAAPDRGATDGVELHLGTRDPLCGAALAVEVVLAAAVGVVQDAPVGERGEGAGQETLL